MNWEFGTGVSNEAKKLKPNAGRAESWPAKMGFLFLKILRFTLCICRCLAQRLRDNIKTWLASSDIKDKKAMQDAKKLIEMVRCFTAFAIFVQLEFRTNLNTDSGLHPVHCRSTR